LKFTGIYKKKKKTEEEEEEEQSLKLALIQPWV